MWPIKGDSLFFWHFPRRMEMYRGLHWFLILFLILPSGCTHVISRDLRADADASLTFSQVHHNPSIFKGKLVIWGGEIIDTTNQKDGTTQIEAFQRPLGWRGEPDVRTASAGRFLIFTTQFLDPYIFRKGMKVTVAGEILGERVKPIGDMNYRYPLISGKQVYLWPDYYYGPHPTGNYYPWVYYDSWWVHPRR